MKPTDANGAPGRVNQIESHPRPTLRDHLIISLRLFTIAGVLFLVLWFVDQMVSS